MAREFGKMSYAPENLRFVMNGIGSENGAPWRYLNRLLDVNIMLAAYRTPSTAEELSVEVGVALPYIEEELNALTENTLMKKNGKKYETNFFIISADAQRKAEEHLKTVIHNKSAFSRRRDKRSSRSRAICRSLFSPR